MSKISILEVHDVSVRYMTGDFKDIGLKEYAVRKLKGNYHINEFWADRHITFSLEKGDMLGIIGTNGAGKSTLLKAVSGIMEPTGGYVRREGNIAALLELASGFDGDLTVRENAYLRGAMLGYTRRFMDEKYDEIIDFAELRDFQDRPFKQLSSGMKSRLAFSIASLVAPDILILDEVLSVGDGAFRKKSEDKMREIIAGGATTILVSHSIEQVRNMCNKVLWLHKGEQVEFGDNVQEICDKYQQFLAGEMSLEEADKAHKEPRNKDQKPQEKTATRKDIGLKTSGKKSEADTPLQGTEAKKGTGVWPLTTRKQMGNLALTGIVLAELFIMFLMSFPRLDDLTWGSSIGIDRLSTWFEGYNGRYVGNIIVIILTRLPAGIRAIVELTVMCALLYYVYQLLPQKKAFLFSILALLGLPLPIWAQSVVWTAGFANYATSAAVLLYVMTIYYSVVIQGSPLSKSAHVIFLAVSFLGQLILENTTICIVILAFYFLTYGLFKKKKLYIPALTGLILSVCGALVLFSNSSYHSALTGDGGNYKSLALSPLVLWKKFQDEVIPHLVQNNHILNFALAIVLTALWIVWTAEKRNGEARWKGKTGIFCGTALIAFFFYDLVDSNWVRVLSQGQAIYAVVSLFYATYIIVTICVVVSEQENRFVLLLFAGTEVILVVPLVPAAPLNARCFFQNGILWAMLLGSLLQILIKRLWGEPGKGRAMRRKGTALTQIICVCYLAAMMLSQSQSWHIQTLRIKATEAGIRAGVETIVLPEVPWSSLYCYGANISNTNDYWLTNYKRYYEIPMETKLEFMDYNKWKESYYNDQGFRQ